MWDCKSGVKFTGSNVKEIIMIQYTILEPEVSAEMLTSLMWVPPSQSHDLLTNASTVELHFPAPERHWCCSCCWDGLNLNAALSQEEKDSNSYDGVLHFSHIISFTFFISYSQTEYLQTEKSTIPFPISIFYFPLSCWVYPIYYIEYSFTV